MKKLINDLYLAESREEVRDILIGTLFGWAVLGLLAAGIIYMYAGIFFFFPY